MSAEYAPVRAVFHGWRELSRGKVKEHDGAFPSANDIGISGRAAGGSKPNWGFTNAKALYSIMLAAMLREPTGTEHEFIKPGTTGVKCIMPIEREGELPTGAGFVLIEGRCVWNELQTRDQTNYTAIIGKFLPDVLEQNGYLKAHDDWFGVQLGNFARGLNRRRLPYTEFMFFPSPDRLVVPDEGAENQGLF